MAFKTPDIFGNTTATTVAMQSYNNLFADEISADHHVINATEGGIPIPRIQNLSLREALNAHCRETIRETTRNILQKAMPTFRPAILSEALRVQASRLQQLYASLLDIKKRFTQNPGKTGQTQFVREMEAVYRSLVADPDTVQLLQGYSYSEFLQWNQKHTEIARKAQR